MSLSESTLHRLCFCYQEMVGLLDVGVVDFSQVIGGEWVGNPSTMTLADAVVEVYISPIVDLINTSYLTVKR